MAEAPGYQTLSFAVLARKASETAVSSLNELCKTGPDLSDTEKKIALLKCILKTRQQLLRLLALSKWCRQVNLLFIILFICCQQTFNRARSFITFALCLLSGSYGLFNLS
jgi:hypothetical protein